MKALIKYLQGKWTVLTNKRCSSSAIVFDSKVDKTASIRQKTRFYESKIGRYSYVGRNSLVQCTNIGAFCSISEGVNIGMPMHPMNYASTSPVFLEGNNILQKNFSRIPFQDCPVTNIGNDVWIGAHVQINSGLTIGNGAVIGAGAIVTHDVPDYAIAVGVPARVIRYRFDEQQIKALNASEWWNLSDDEINSLAGKIEDVNKFISSIERIKK